MATRARSGTTRPHTSQGLMNRSPAVPYYEMMLSLGKRPASSISSPGKRVHKNLSNQDDKRLALFVHTRAVTLGLSRTVARGYRIAYINIVACAVVAAVWIKCSFMNTAPPSLSKINLCRERTRAYNVNKADE